MASGSAARDLRRSGVQMIRQLCKSFEPKIALQVFFRAVDIFETYLRAGGRLSADGFGLLKTTTVCVMISAKVVGITHTHALVSKTCPELRQVSKKELICHESEVLFAVDFNVVRMTISEALALVLLCFCDPELIALFPDLLTQAEHMAFICTLEGALSPNCNGVLTTVSIVTAAARANYALSSADRIRDDVMNAVNRLLEAQSLDKVKIEHIMDRSRQLTSHSQAKLGPWLNRTIGSSRIQNKI